MKQILPSAYFDSLMIMDEMPASLRPISFVEYHLYSYLSCVLALFKGESISSWGYKYTVTEYGFPFSNELQHAIDFLLNRG
ncbi:TPA: hypothetical protein ACR6U8_005202, partial [Klebsiella pneumoniae]